MCFNVNVACRFWRWQLVDGPRFTLCAALCRVKYSEVLYSVYLSVGTRGSKKKRVADVFLVAFWGAVRLPLSVGRTAVKVNCLFTPHVGESRPEPPLVFGHALRPFVAAVAPLCSLFLLLNTTPAHRHRWSAEYVCVRHIRGIDELQLSNPYLRDSYVRSIPYALGAQPSTAQPALPACFSSFRENTSVRLHARRLKALLLAAVMPSPYTAC